ncbi:MAG: glycosyltransferase family 2 protein [Candidatus Scalindua sp.]|jgi:glycosyltransferase involved in cell wall biosynthesis|nr:glycosyltransferase family 2 protein [Candidatus Scalindua sp.]
MINSISIILPALNEEGNIEAAVNDIQSYFNSREEKYEIIVINDGSTDSTGEIAERLAKKNGSVRAIHHSINKGYGSALKEGFKSSKYKYVFFTDSDRQFDIKGLDILLPLIKTDAVEIIIGYRLKRKDPFLRRFLSWGYNSLVGCLFDLNVKDIDCAFKVFRKDIFSNIKIESKNFFVNTEILAKARHFGFNVLEVGVPHFPRTAGKTTVSFKHIPMTLIELYRIRKEIKKLKRNESTAG